MYIYRQEAIYITHTKFPLLAYLIVKYLRYAFLLCMYIYTQEHIYLYRYRYKYVCIQVHIHIKSCIYKLCMLRSGYIYGSFMSGLFQCDLRQYSTARVGIYGSIAVGCSADQCTTVNIDKQDERCYWTPFNSVAPTVPAGGTGTNSVMSCITR